MSAVIWINQARLKLQLGGRDTNVICVKPTDVTNKVIGHSWRGLASRLVQARPALCG